MEEAETQIRSIVKEEYVRRTPLVVINKKVNEVIKKALAKVKIPSLRLSATKSLINFFRRQYDEIKRISPDKLLIATFLYSYLIGERKPTEEQKTALRRQNISISNGRASTNLTYGVPLQKFSKDYFRDNVKPIYERLVKQYPLDPNDVSGRNSLRNLAEMEVRYQSHKDSIENLKAKGVKLVIASTHADCSERCAKWQGKVFSLDGTYGTTDDGRHYEPLENATDIYYTTKAGKTYKNGLLGFNCRHFLIPYKSGYRFPKPIVNEERRQYGITLKQRELERQVRKWRTEAITLRGLNREAYLSARQKAIEWNKAYIKFSHDNGRAYYPSRTEIL